MYPAWLCKYLRIVQAIVFVAIFLISTPSYSTKLILRGFDELISLTNVIMEGEVTKVYSSYSNDNTAIYTFVQITKREVFKGRVDQNVIELRFLGGKTKDETIDIPGVPKFTVGESGIFFIRTHFDPTKTISMVEGFEQGKFVFKTNERREEIVQNANGGTIVGYDEKSDHLITKFTAPKLNAPIPRDPKKDRLVDPAAEQKNLVPFTKQEFTSLLRKRIGKNDKGVVFKPYSNEQKLNGLHYKSVPAPRVQPTGDLKK